MNKTTLANNLQSVLSNPRKLLALYAVDALCWVSFGAVAAYCVIKFGGL